MGSGVSGMVGFIGTGDRAMEAIIQTGLFWHLVIIKAYKLG